MRQTVPTQLSLELPSVEEERRSSGPAPKSAFVLLAGKARLTLAEAARIIREAVKDKSYRKTPLGQLVGRYLRWFRNEYGATESTIRDYEAVLARMSLLLADREPLEVSTEDLREVIDTWAMRHARTRAKVTSVIPSLLGVGRGGGSRPILPRLKDQATARAAENGPAPPRSRRRAAP